MRGTVAMLLVCLMGVQPTALLAGQGGTTDQPASVRFDALGVSFERIKRELRIQPATTSSGTSPLKLDFYVEVPGFAPEIQLFTPADFASLGPVPGAPPTHREMIRDLWTRPEFKGQSVPIGSLAIMGIMKLAQWQAGQVKKRKAEADRQRRLEELKEKYPDLIVK